MEHWQLIYSATRTNQQLRLARAARVQALSVAEAKEAQGRRDRTGSSVLRADPSRSA
jgi:hypothetical protein